MFSHNLLITFRSLKRHKGSFLINLIGLSTGLACVCLIYLWVNDEMHFDAFHQTNDQLYQVLLKGKNNENIVVQSTTQGILPEAMAKELPEVQEALGMMYLKEYNINLTLKSGSKTFKTDGVFADKNFFSIFSFPLIQGNPTQVLADQNSVVISQKLARQFFGSAENAVGKTLEWELMGTKKEAVVSGILGDVPANSSLQFEFVGSFPLFLQTVWTNGLQWGNTGSFTYAVLKPGTDIAKFNQKLAGFIKKHDQYAIQTPFARLFSSGYLYGNYENGVQSGGRIEYVRMLSLVAIFILVIACINFMNLSTAKASRRLKEVGIKKAIGSTRQTLIAQFLSEAIFMTFVSFLVAGVLVLLLLPQFNELTGKQIALQFTLKSVSITAGIILLTGLMAGSYPAFYLSGFQPIAVLKGSLKNSFGELLARKTLVVFQFTISLILIVSVLVVYRQMSYVQTKNLGYDKDNVIEFAKEGALLKNANAFITELRGIPGVVNASAIQQGVVGGGSSTFDVHWPGKKDKEIVDMGVRTVDYEFIETLNIPIKEGRGFSKKFGSDTSSAIFNETAIKIMGMKEPLGKTVTMWGKQLQIVGVVKDFHIQSLHNPIEPLVFRYNPDETQLVYVKIAAGKEAATLPWIEKLYKQFNPGYQFEFTFLDQSYQAQYVAEQRISLLSRYFAGLAILISCLGLFGLVAFSAEIRTKEIGIRKILGASVAHITLLLSKDFFKLILIAVLIAFPIAWWAMNSWLAGFVYRIDVEPMIFIAALVAVFAITVLTVGYQAIKAAIANPVKSLRSE